jgi:putative addiction module component (TIGR02574 family)
MIVLFPAANKSLEWTQAGDAGCRSRGLGRPRRSVLCIRRMARARQPGASEYRSSMAELVETLAEEAMQLPPDQRLTLAHKILSSVEPASSPELEAVWDTEIRARIARYDGAETRGIPASEVFAELDRRLGR